jgi:hypothetical protein
MEALLWEEQIAVGLIM